MNAAIARAFMPAQGPGSAPFLATHATHVLHDKGACRHETGSRLSHHLLTMPSVSPVSAYTVEEGHGNAWVAGDEETNVSSAARVQSLPVVLQHFIRWQVKHHKWFYACIQCTCGTLPYVLCFSCLLGSVPVGIAISSALVFTYAMAFVTPDFGEGIFLEMIVEHAEMMAKNTKSKCVGDSITGLVLVIPFVSLPAIFALSPESSNYNLFGQYTNVLIYSSFVTFAVSQVVECAMYTLVQQVMFQIPKVWDDKIEKYVKGLQARLLEFKCDSDKRAKSDFLEELYRSEHQQVESWAIHYNEKMSTWNGLMLLLPLYLLGVFTGAAAILQLQNKSGEDSFKILGLSGFALLTIAGFLTNTHLMTKPNRCWMKHVKLHLLNDPRLQHRIEILFGFRFDDWLRSHEVSATRAFGFQMTPQRIMRVGATIGSAFGVVLTLIVGEELRALYGQGGG